MSALSEKAWPPALKLFGVIHGVLTWPDSLGLLFLPVYVYLRQHSLPFLRRLQGGLLLWRMFPIRCHLQFLYLRHHSGWNVTEALHFTQSLIPCQVTPFSSLVSWSTWLPSNVFGFLDFKSHKLANHQHITRKDHLVAILVRRKHGPQ
jgi:hypothetical protein